MEAWFGSYPRHEQADLRGRFRSKDSRAFAGAFFELYCHALLLAQSYAVGVHQTADERQGTRIDLEARKNGEPVFLLECTISAASNEAAGIDSRKEQVYAAIDKLESPNFFFGVEVKSAGQASLAGAKVRAFLHRQLAGLDPDEVAAHHVPGDMESIPHWTFEDGDWRIVFFPMPIKPEARGKTELRPLGARLEPARWIDTTGAIRASLDEKAVRYGQHTLPYVIAVNGVEEMVFPADEEDIYAALFGTLAHNVRFNSDARTMDVEPFRKRDGFWLGPEGARNTQVSAILIGSVMPWSVAAAPVTLWHNPWAAAPVPLEAWLGPQMVPDMDTGEFQPRPGMSPSEILGLPSHWPRA
jgi:hypothetical protein